MANVINKKTLEYRKSVNTPDYENGDWIINPWLPDCDKKYWRVYKGQVKEMTSAQKASVDSAEQEKADANLKESLIESKKQEIMREQAIQELISEGKLNSDGSLVR